MRLNVLLKNLIFVSIALGCSILALNFTIYKVTLGKTLQYWLRIRLVTYSPHMFLSTE